MEITLEGKKFHVGLKWITCVDKSDASEKAEQFKEQGYGVFTLKVGDKWQLCINREGKFKHPVLATGFLHLVYGYYYIPLEKGVWVFLKGADGVVIEEGVYESLERFEAENNEKVLPFLADGVGRKPLSLSEGKDFKSPRQVRPVFLALPLLALVLLGGVFLAMKFLFKEEPPKPPPRAVSSAPAVVESPPSAPPWGRIDLSCYEKFYQKALLEGQGSCEWELSASENQKTYPQCEEATRKLMLAGASLQWGQVTDYGEALGYSFSLSGELFAQDLKGLQDIPFALLKLSVNGSPSRPQVSLSGVLLCVR